MATASLNLPELAPAEGLEVRYVGVEADPEAPERLVNSASLHRKEARSVRKVVQKPTAWWNPRYLGPSVTAVLHHEQYIYTLTAQYRISHGLLHHFTLKVDCSSPFKLEALIFHRTNPARSFRRHNKSMETSLIIRLLLPRILT